MKRRKNNKIYIVLLLVLFISIGFAYLSATLNINGLANITGNSWKIYFDNIQYVRGQEYEITAPTTTGKTTTSVSYEVFLPSPGDTYKFNIDVVNEGTLDAMVKVVNDTELTSQQKVYTSYYVTYNDGISVDDYQLLPKNSRDTLSVIVSYNKDIKEEDMPTEDKSITVKFHLEYEQATSKATARNHITVVNRQTEGQLSVGDEIALDDEHFYIMETNEEKMTLMSKYNINISTFKQDATNSGVVVFSNVDYWYDNGLKPIYGNTWIDNCIYDDQYSSSDGPNYSVAYYVTEYKKELNKMNMKIIKSRLITINELYSYGCIYNNQGHNCNNISAERQFITTVAYWVGSFSGYYQGSFVWNVYSRGAIGGQKLEAASTNYVRPVIEIPALDI